MYVTILEEPIVRIEIRLVEEPATSPLAVGIYLQDEEGHVVQSAGWVSNQL